MTGSQPLLHGFAGPHAVFAWRRGEPIACATFLDDVRRTAARLPERGFVLNACVDRYRFAVGLAAALLRGQVSLMPPTTQPSLVRQLLDRFPDTYCLVEDARPDIDLPQVLFDAVCGVDATTRSNLPVPSIPVDRTVAYVFTSGSTGAPVPHRKTWGPLVRNVRSEAERLECRGAEPEADDGPHASLAIVATVPPQHMYGFESSLVMAWQCGAALVAERPFYPADVVAALARLPTRRMLVTTPFHLRALMADASPLPAVEQVLCATAPLSPDLARDVERRFGAPVREIYGCTETGQLASRRPTEDTRWQLLGDVRLAVDARGTATASGGHVEQPTVLSDVLEAADDIATSGRFSLVGRSADLVNIAGKRTSLAYLDVQLNAIDGVADGVFFMPADDAADRDGVTRLAAVVVAPTLDGARLVAALRERIDAAFLPRPVHFVDRLPRNTTGKLTRDTLDALVAGQVPERAGKVAPARTGTPADPVPTNGDASPVVHLPLAVDAAHPAFAGHFPSQPIVPGVVLLDAGLRAVAAYRADGTTAPGPASGEAGVGPGPAGLPGSIAAIDIGAAKFLSIVGPGVALRLELEPTTPTAARPDGDGYRLRIVAGSPGDERVALTANVVFRAPARTDADDARPA